MPATSLKPKRPRSGTARAVAVAALGLAALSMPATPDSRAGPLLDPTAFGFESLDPALARAAAPALAEWIKRSRDAAHAAGAARVPAAIRAALERDVPADVLATTRWCVACGDSLSLQHSALGLARVPAVTLDDVIVFAPGADVGDPALWAHELRHVMQYADWGVAGFAERYLVDYSAVEREAAEFRWQWMKRTGDPRTVAPALRDARERDVDTADE